MKRLPGGQLAGRKLRVTNTLYRNTPNPPWPGLYAWHWTDDNYVKQSDFDLIGCWPRGSPSSLAFEHGQQSAIGRMLSNDGIVMEAKT